MVRSKVNFERGFNDVWLETKDYPAKCELKEYWFPNYDFGAYWMYPLHLWTKKTCKKEFEKETFLFFDDDLNKDTVNNNYQVYPEMNNLTDAEYDNFISI
jgi:hypothetical protein